MLDVNDGAGEAPLEEQSSLLSAICLMLIGVLLYVPGRCRIIVSDAWTKIEMLALRGDGKLKPRAI